MHYQVRPAGATSEEELVSVWYWFLLRCVSDVSYTSRMVWYKELMSCMCCWGISCLWWWWLCINNCSEGSNTVYPVGMCMYCKKWYTDLPMSNSLLGLSSLCVWYANASVVLSWRLVGWKDLTWYERCEVWPCITGSNTSTASRNVFAVVALVM